MMEECLERIWWKISYFINRLFYKKKMKRYFTTAVIVKERVENYLKEHNIDYKSKMLEDLEGEEWVIEIYVKVPTYDEVLKLYELLGDVGYRGFSGEGVFLCIDLWR